MQRVWLGSEGLTFLQKGGNLDLGDGLTSLDKNPFRMCLFRLYHSMSLCQSLLFEVSVSMEQGTVRDMLFQISLGDECALGYPS